MDAKAMRDMGLDELQQKRAEFKDEIFHLTLRRATGQLESPMKLRQSRRDLARLETIIGELRRDAERKAAAQKDDHE
ncbi:MAG: 50S ribosomal protein L29 [Deltaproteobacteria bacterium]|nr:50S ribosomal protein L29 [Deltaproteobacteria bacterium]